MSVKVSIRKHLHSGGRSFELNVDFSSEAEIIVLMGTSGAGKTMTLQALSGLLTPDAGHISVKGRVLFDSAAGINLPPQQRGIGYVFQDYALFPHFSVAGNLAFGLGNSLIPRRRPERIPLVAETLERLGLSELARSYPGQLSGGQRQRVALGRALILRPSLLLLDEPFCSLDAGLRASLRQEFMEVRSRYGIPSIVVTHDQEDAGALQGQVINY